MGFVVLSNPALSDNSTKFDGYWQGVMECGDCRQSPCGGPFTNSIRILIKEKKISFGAGIGDDIGGELEVDDDDEVKVSIWGSYSSRKKIIDFEGEGSATAFLEELTLSGRRGPRHCNLSLAQTIKPKSQENVVSTGVDPFEKISGKLDGSKIKLLFSGLNATATVQGFPHSFSFSPGGRVEAANESEKVVGKWWIKGDKACTSKSITSVILPLRPEETCWKIRIPSHTGIYGKRRIKLDGPEDIIVTIRLQEETTFKALANLMLPATEGSKDTGVTSSISKREAEERIIAEIGGNLPPCPPRIPFKIVSPYDDCVGIQNYPDGSKYVGEWKDGKKHGQGTFTHSDGLVEQGRWESNRFLAAKKTPTKRGTLPPCPEQGVWNNCVGTFTYPDGGQYVGEWKDDKMHGKGTFNYTDGSKYVGEWKDSIRYGKGTLYYAHGGEKQEGIFENNKLLYTQKITPTITAEKEKYLLCRRATNLVGGWMPVFKSSKIGGAYTGAYERNLDVAKAKEIGLTLDECRKVKLAYTAKSRRKTEKEKKRLAEIARREAEERRVAEEEKKRLVEERRVAEKEKKRLAEIARREAEERRVAEARAAAKRKKARYDALVASANADLAVAQDFIAAHPGTPVLLDIVTYIAGTKAALKKGNVSRVKSALGSLRATLSKEKGFSTFLALKEKKRKQRLVAERRLAEEKRKQEIAEAKRQKEEKKRRRAAQVIILKEDLKSYAGFLKRQITQLVKSSPETAQALVPVIKSLEGGLSSNDLSALKKLKGKANADLRKHGLANQYAQVQKLLTMARKAKREKITAAERRAKARKGELARLVAERKAAQKKEATLAALSARQEKYREAVAVVIGNRKYANRVPEVSFAHNDAHAMRKYLMGLGYREGNIIYIRDATQSQLLAVFGTEKSHRGKLFSYVRPGESDVTVFYSGHGVPGLKDRRGYLLPVDADPNLVELNGYPIDLLYGNLNKLGAKTMRVYMDACFSGDSPKGMLVRATSGISVKPLMPKKKAGSAMISITAAQGDQFASWDEDAKHGLFTKHLLTALGGTADKGRYGNGDGNVSVGEVKKYLDREMTYQARRRYNRDQVATVQGDSKLVLSSYR